MWSGAPHISGLRVATSYNKSTFGKYVHPFQTWSLEIAFPIRSGTSKDGALAHGGLLSAANGADMHEFDPAQGDAAFGLPRFWYIDFSRAEHPRAYSRDKADSEDLALCPLNCSAKLVEYNASLSNPTAAQCKQAAQEFPTLLGDDAFYGCYWEWAWQSVGSVTPYMHQPSTWGLLQFASSKAAPMCLSLEHPPRFLVWQLHVALARWKELHGNYTSSVEKLLSSEYCSLSVNGCDLQALVRAASLMHIFRMAVAVTMDAVVLSRQCTSRPCYEASVLLSVPCNSCAEPWTISARINENQYLQVHVNPGKGPAPCLGSGPHGESDAPPSFV
jgi:hypothetical protein